MFNAEPEKRFQHGRNSPHNQSAAPQEYSYPALLAYRSTPLQDNLYPSELLMRRHLRTKVPSIPSVLKPNVEDTDRQRLQLTVDENW